MKNWYEPLKQRYSSFPGHVQVLNMVSDLEKAASARGKGIQAWQNNLLRAIILLDYIINDPKWDHALHELLRLRDAICSIIAGIDYGTIEQVIQAALLLDPAAYNAVKRKHA